MMSVLHDQIINGVRHRSALSCWIDDAWRELVPHGPEAVIAAISELASTAADKWPEQRKAILQELAALQQQLSE